ncbi:protein-methionine-sulfoxide reductase catalytic subunit MsrP [Bryobacter aggregatus]|uniref:protein-methionine-sulfoxide reductase catalytic subunit MsrP n=1 Tax=Bryobacter aggregatus TaxID=360054 RepID=UPI00068CF6CB|nr:protein-methionine-sulfoxide reductase catalytic subunit MsrP [Bryobacter aggregatus]
MQSLQITPKNAWLGRRAFLAALGGGAVASAVPFPSLRPSPLSLAEKPNRIEDVTTYNNYYEFGTNKKDPVVNAKSFRTDPWTLRVEGLVSKPLQLSLPEILKLAPLEERVYRFRCVEGWSAVIPWAGYSLSKLIEKAAPRSGARFVAFETYFDEGQMPLAKQGRLAFPYVEGLRLDEAMHPLTLLATGMYGEALPPQNGAPVRLIVPWKYGFKSAKSLVRIRLTNEQPATSWNLKKANEYGFYSNVNPNVPHPRWSQATERRLGELSKRPTLLFNGYEKEVAHLYRDLDLMKNF